MTTKARIRASVLVAFLATTSSVIANNNLFLPGDAFFPTVLTKADTEVLQATKTGARVFPYSSFDGYVGAFCGYAGYINASIPAVDDAFAKNLATVYARIREGEHRKLVERTHDGKTELIETNGIRVLFYPHEFVFPGHSLGLRYNENWVSEVVKFGHRRQDLRLCSLIPDPDAVERCWRDADLVPPLKVKLPNVELKSVPATEAPVVVQGPVKAIVIGSHTLKELFQCGNDDYLTVYVVDAKRITEMVHDDGKWQPASAD